MLGMLLAKDVVGLDSGGDQPVQEKSSTFALFAGGAAAGCASFLRALVLDVDVGCGLGSGW